jgi:hypothetical protein
MDRLFTSLRLIVVVAAVWLGGSLSPARAASPGIVITNMPAFGALGNLSGFVTNANPATNSVAVFIFVAGGWYSKPGCASPLTPIQPNGSWSANITIYPSDTNATEIAAFLMPTNYNQPCADGTNGLAIPSQAEATVYVDRVNPSARQFNFAGYGWWVKTASGLAGPGPNYFTDSTNNVWVDAQGQLHLKITQTNGQWQCVEIISDRSFGYGQYRYTVLTPVSTLGTNAVLGMFTWSYDAAYNYREIDIEQSRWEYGYGTNNVEDYALAPYGPGQTLNFTLPVTLANTTHCLIWRAGNVAFQSLNGGFALPPAATNVLEMWNNSLGVPPAGGEQVHINLWLDNGNPPGNGQPIEAVVSGFEFVPIGAVLPAQLGPLTGLPGAPQLTVQGQANWHYEIDASSNMLDWMSLGEIAPTNAVFQFTDTNPVSARARFYRTVTEP